MSITHRFLSGIGIDLSDHHVRLAQVNVFGSLGRLEEIELPEGFVVDEKILAVEKLKKFLTEKFTRLNFSHTGARTTVLIPESRVFAHAVLLDASLRGEELRARARELSQRDIPVPFSQAHVCVSEGAKEQEKMRLTVYAVEKEIFDPLFSTFQSPFHLVAMEANTKALLRLLQRFGIASSKKESPHHLIGIVDIGHSWTTISFYTQQGSNMFSRTIPHRIKEATDLKNPLLPDWVVDMVIETIGQIMIFFEGNKMQIGKLVFAGVEAHDDRLKEKLAKSTSKLSCELIGDIVRPDHLSKKQIHTFGAAIGAAVRSLNPRRYESQHNFLKCK